MSELNYIIFDLEWNTPITRYRERRNGADLHGEIIQIGAVKTNAALEVIDTFTALVKPQVYHKMLRDITELTDITDEMLADAEPFQTVLPAFLEWCGREGEYAFFSWGPSDILYLEDNMQFHGMDISGLPVCYDMQVMFDDQITQDGRDFALSYAMWKLDIKPARSHDALNDALNTVEVMRHFDFSDGLDGYEV